MNAPIHIEFRRNDDVRLLHHHGDIRSGTCGRVLGRFARSTPTYVVSFDEHGVVELCDHEIVLTGDESASA